MDNQSFIQQHLTKSIPEIALLLSKHSELDKNYILSQINGLQKAQKKLPEFYKNKQIVYPVFLSIEQCSSEQTAIFKSTVLRHSGLDLESSIVDLTGGFGVDSYYFSKVFKEITYLEPNKELFNLVKNNFRTLNASNINCIHTSTEDFLNTHTQKFDLAYIDPSRRSENQKVFMLQDCVPNIVELKDDILKTASQILIKTSPILDIKQSLKELENVNTVWVVSVNNECKEVLYLVDAKPITTPIIHTINLTQETQEFSFNYGEEENCVAQLSELLAYLYEPNASIFKAGGFKTIASQFNLKKLANNTHLYTSNELVTDFPGRSFEVKNILPYQPKQFKKLGIKKANVACRNFKDTVAQVKKKLNLQDGGNEYIFATTELNNKPILIVTNKA